MEQPCGETFNNLLDQNETLINFDFSMNNFSMEDSREIQEKLRRNKKKYDDDRLREWRERKLMRGEDNALRLLFIKEASKKEQDNMEEDAKEVQEAEMNEKWKKFLLENEIEKQQTIERLIATSLMKKKKKKGKGKKK